MRLYDDSLFAGAAPYYDRGRLPYAPGLANALAAALSLDGRGRLLDAGCGPGSVTLLFAHLFEEAVGLDADAEMLNEAGRLARVRGIANTRWVHAAAEELPAGLGTFRVITFAASFHWMDRPRVAAAAREMLDPGGAVVHVDNRHQDGVAPPAAAPHPPPPDDAIDDLVRRYLGPHRRAGQGVCTGTPSGEDAVFRAAGFTGPQRVAVPDGRLLDRTSDDIIASRLSSSGSAPHLFAERLADFIADLRTLLEAASPTGRYNVRLPDNELNIWRPASV
jgi:SAM-dependent methyltransferase